MEPDFKLLARVHELYRNALADSSKARAWLARKGVTDAGILERFGIGFAPGTLKTILPHDAQVRRALRELGLLEGRGRGRERLAGGVVVPLFDTTGRLMELLGYPLGRGAARRAGIPGALFNALAMKAHPEVRLLENPIEAMAEISRGNEAVVALPGDRWTKLTETIFTELAPHEVVVDRAAKRRQVVERLRALEIGDRGKTASAVPEAAIENGFPASFGRRRYLVQAVSQDNPRHLRALVRAVGTTPGRFHLDAMDLYSSRDRSVFVREAALLFGEEASLVEADLARLISLAEEHLRRRPGSATKEVGEEAREEAMELLRDPKLVERLLEDFRNLGLVGEETNKLAGYLVATSRKLEDPLSMLVLSRSAAGKSALSEAVTSLMPPEEVVRVTRLTGQALFYGKQSLRHKLLVVEEESGVTQAAYPLRVLQSAKRLAVATPQGSREVEGPVAVIVTTTSSNLNDETKSRFLVVSVDESRPQTRAIQEEQRKREAGVAVPREEILRRHHALQRCLRPLRVVNPFAPKLTFPDHRLSTRREHPKYLGLIRAVAFLHQHQRKEDDEGSVRVELADLELAHRLSESLLGQSLEDLSPTARRLLEAIHKRKPKGSFTRRELCESLGWPWVQVWTYTKELLGQEWLVSRGGKPQRLESLWDGREGRIFLGLRSIDEIRADIGRKSGFIGSRGKR